VYYFCSWTVLAAVHQLRQDKHQDMRQKTQSSFTRDSSASWLRPVCGDFHNLIHFNCAPFFASCRRHRVLTHTGVRPTFSGAIQTAHRPTREEVTGGCIVWKLIIYTHQISLGWWSPGWRDRWSRLHYRKGKGMQNKFKEPDLNEGDHFEDLRIGIDGKITLKRVLKLGGT
jgi:hypothetical protein